MPHLRMKRKNGTGYMAEAGCIPEAGTNSVAPLHLFVPVQGHVLVCLHCTSYLADSELDCFLGEPGRHQALRSFVA
jgi:hypothetical protein